jgi:hypothetical protein
MILTYGLRGLRMGGDLEDVAQNTVVRVLSGGQEAN